MAKGSIHGYKHIKEQIPAQTVYTDEENTFTEEQTFNVAPIIDGETLPAPSDIIKKDGTVDFSANQSMGNNKITSLKNGVLDGDAATLGQVNALVTGHRSPVDVLKMVSDADQGGSPPVGPSDGDAYVVNNWGLGFTTNDIVEWDGSVWNVVQAGSFGMLPDGVRCIVKKTGSSGSFASESNKIGTYNGVTASWEFAFSNDGDAAVIKGNGSIYEGQVFIYDVATNNWGSTGSATPHNSTSMKQGGTTDEYFHLTQDELNSLAGMDKTSQPNIYWISKSTGDDTNGDGSINKPFETIDEAVTVGTGLYTQTMIVLDGDDYSAETITVPAAKKVSIFVPTSAYTDGKIGPCVVGAGSFLQLANVDVQGTMTGDGSIILEDCTALNFPAVSGTIFLRGFKFTSIPATGWIGYAFGASSIMHVRGASTVGMNVSAQRIEAVADPSSAQDVATMNYVDKKTRAGTVASGSFGGSPLTYDVDFTDLGLTDMPNTNYAITIVGVDLRSWTYSAKTVTGFTIHTNSSTALTGNVDWVCTRW